MGKTYVLGVASLEDWMVLARDGSSMSRRELGFIRGTTFGYWRLILAIKRPWTPAGS